MYSDKIKTKPPTGSTLNCVYYQGPACISTSTVQLNGVKMLSCILLTTEYASIFTFDKLVLELSQTLIMSGIPFSCEAYLKHRGVVLEKCLQGLTASGLYLRPGLYSRIYGNWHQHYQLTVMPTCSRKTVPVFLEQVGITVYNANQEHKLHRSQWRTEWLSILSVTITAAAATRVILLISAIHSHHTISLYHLQSQVNLIHVSCTK